MMNAIFLVISVLAIPPGGFALYHSNLRRINKQFWNHGHRNNFLSKYSIHSYYPIGKEGQAWGAKEKAEWMVTRVRHRSYAADVLAKLRPLERLYDVVQYGLLSYEKGRYPLYVVKTRNWTQGKPSVLVTGGVHGYERSGVHGALQFLSEWAQYYHEKHGFNVAVVPSVSPWGYEYVERWNPNAEDPNRGFTGPDSSREECGALWRLVDQLGGKDAFFFHVDLHETTHTDLTEFLPALAARDGKIFMPRPDPEGFYLVDDSLHRHSTWDATMIRAVREVIPIAHPDESGNIIRYPVAQDGVIAIPVNEMHICSSVTNAPYAITTEVWPDSPGITNEQCNNAQVAAITSGLNFIIENVARSSTP